MLRTSFVPDIALVTAATLITALVFLPVSLFVQTFEPPTPAKVEKRPEAWLVLHGAVEGGTAGGASSALVAVPIKE